jgi:hypothetical protein
MARTTTGAMVLYVMPDSSVRPALVWVSTPFTKGWRRGWCSPGARTTSTTRMKARWAACRWWSIARMCAIRSTLHPRTPGTWHTLAENSQDKAEED